MDHFESTLGGVYTVMSALSPVPSFPRVFFTLKEVSLTPGFWCQHSFIIVDNTCRTCTKKKNKNEMVYGGKMESFLLKRLIKRPLDDWLLKFGEGSALVNFRMKKNENLAILGVIFEMTDM